MADIRINSLPTTASASSSDDFLALDGATNGTRKLNAYSPTFGGNLTVSGTSALSGAVKLGSGSAVALGAQAVVVDAGSEMRLQLNSTDRPGIYFTAAGSNLATMRVNSTAFELLTTSGTPISISQSTLATTFGGNLTVSGGTITGGTSGLSLASGGTNQSITLTPSGTGATVISKAETNTNAITTALNYIKIQNTSSGGTYIGALEFYTWDNRRAAGIFANRNNVDGTSGVLSFAYSTSGNSFAEGFRLNYTGNLLIGTTTDGGQKLQVSGTGYVSGRLTTNTGTLVTGGESISTGAGQPIGVQLRYGSVADTAELLAFDWANNGAKNLTLRGTTVTLQTGTYGGTTALTLDSSQNATFAGDVTVSGGNLGVGSTATSIRSIICGGTLSGGSTQNGIYIGAAAGTDATSEYSGITIQPTASAGSYTIGSGYGISIATPSIGTSAAITTQLGLYISNQGVSGKTTNAYGIKIAAQSGAATTNIGLLNLGATVLATPAAAVTLADNSTMTFELTSNTSLTIKVRGTDGTTRSVALTLA